MKLPGAAASHQIIRKQCREGRGSMEAFDEAMRRIRQQYAYLVANGIPDDTELHLILVVQAERHRKAEEQANKDVGNVERVTE